MSIQPKRIGCGDDITTTTSTNTMMTVTEKKKKRAYKRKNRRCETTTTSTEPIPRTKRAYRRKKYLSHDLIRDEILTKLPVRTLLKSVLVSKLWYKSIHNDHRRLASAHLLQSQKHPQVVFSLLNVRSGVTQKPGTDPTPKYRCHFFRLPAGIHSRYNENSLQFFEKFPSTCPSSGDIWELVGYCHGLSCMARGMSSYLIVNPNRNDYLYINPVIVDQKRISNAAIICHGFGFDPSEQVYKLVCIFRTPQKALNVMVFTLGTKSWRNVTVTSTPPVSGHGGRPIIKVRAPMGCDKSAIFCTSTSSSSSSSSSSGCLVWKLITTLGGAGSNGVHEVEMLLSFNLHDEKHQFIELPATSTTDDQQKHSLIDYPHLLEFKGSPCIVRVEKKSVNGSDIRHRFRYEHRGSSSCCCCCTLHLYVLTDKVKQVWVKEESYDVRINSTTPLYLRSLAPDPCCFCFGSTTTTPPTRIHSFSDQMYLYWFNGGSLQVYNLGSKKNQVVLTSRLDYIFQAKMKEPRHALRSGDDDIYCSNMDYQLHSHEENLLSLETFVPEGVTGVDADEFRRLYDMGEGGPWSAYVVTFRSSRVYYLF